MKVIGFLIGILLLLVAGGISYVAIELRNRGELGWKAFPAAITILGLTLLGTHLTVGISSENISLANFWIALVAVSCVPSFILGGKEVLKDFVRDCLAGDITIISKPLDSGIFKRYFNITIQWIVTIILGWMIWNLGKLNYKIYFG